MPLSKGEEMTEQACGPIRRNAESRYAIRDDFLKIFNEDLNGLYQLSFLLTGDHQKGERCFVAGIEDCAKENRVFREWARAWAKRVIVEKAIRELNPRRHSNSSAPPTVFSRNQQSSGPIRLRPQPSFLAISSRAVQSDTSLSRMCYGFLTSSGLFSYCAFWSTTENASVLCFSAARLPKFGTRALGQYRSWLSLTQVVPTRMKIVSEVGGQKRSRRERSPNEGTCT